MENMELSENFQIRCLKQKTENIYENIYGDIAVYKMYILFSSLLYLLERSRKLRDVAQQKNIDMLSQLKEVRIYHKTKKFSFIYIRPFIFR